MSLAWYVKRLAAMSPPELLHRVGEQAKRRLSRRRSYGWDAFAPKGRMVAVPGLTGRLREGSTEAFRTALNEATASLLAGHFSAHGVDWPRRTEADPFPAAMWRLDPVTGKSWPGADVYCFDISYRHASDIGDIKFVWDYNRLQFLQPLAAAFALDGREDSLHAIEIAIASWKAANPPFGGLGWNSGIELALRAVTLALVYSLCREALSAGTRSDIHMILAAHLYWMRRYPSRFSSANNHLVSEAMAEFIVASILPDEPGAAAVVSHARHMLEREAGLQILPDGVGAEQSPTYGAFTAEMLILADLVARAFGAPLAPVVGERLRAFATFVGVLSDADGIVPAIGDDDEGRVLSLSHPREAAYPASVARAIAGHLGEAPTVPPGADVPELRNALFSVASASAAPADGVYRHDAGGYCVVREQRAGRRVKFVLDHGPLGYLSIAAHGHADANAIALSLDDLPVLVDAGTYLYHSGGVWRDWFRGTGAHNTVRLGGLDQSVISGPFNWSHKANASLDRVETGEAWSLTARHDGYLKRFGVEHVRQVSAAVDGLVIEDKLLGAGAPLDAEVIFQFAPGLAVAPDDGLWMVRRDGTTVLALMFSELGEVSVAKGGRAPGEGGWVSPNFGTKLPAPRLVWRGRLPAAGLRTTLNWG